MRMSVKLCGISGLANYDRELLQVMSEDPFGNMASLIRRSEDMASRIRRSEEGISEPLKFEFTSTLKHRLVIFLAVINSRIEPLLELGTPFRCSQDPLIRHTSSALENLSRREMSSGNERGRARAAILTTTDEFLETVEAAAGRLV
ncbi:hypothetical protein JCM5350_005029 [Sporobolomyces pararoseus]